MAKQSGRSFLLKIGAVAGSPVTVAGLLETSIAVNNEQVDCTNKDSNGYRELLEGAGVQSVEITASGRLDDGSAAETLRGYANANSIDTYSLFYPDGTTYEGSFAVSAYSDEGPEADAMSYSVTLQSSGQLTYVAA